jgi:hypothetical protein
LRGATTWTPPRLADYWVIALSLAGQAWSSSNEAPRPVTQPGARSGVLVFALAGTAVSRNQI